jgi:hypothetical protein
MSDMNFFDGHNRIKGLMSLIERRSIEIIQCEYEGKNIGENKYKVSYL